MLRTSRSDQNEPLAPGIGCTAANHAMVSAPCSGERKIGFVIRRNAGIESCTPGVSAQPGCIESKWMDRSLVAHISFSVTCARFAIAYCLAYCLLPSANSSRVPACDGTCGRTTSSHPERPSRHCHWLEHHETSVGQLLPCFTKLKRIRLRRLGVDQ